jgi:hypothetical protein
MLVGNRPVGCKWSPIFGPYSAFACFRPSGARRARLARWRAVSVSQRGFLPVRDPALAFVGAASGWRLGWSLRSCGTFAVARTRPLRQDNAGAIRRPYLRLEVTAQLVLRREPGRVLHVAECDRLAVDVGNVAFAGRREELAAVGHVRTLAVIVGAVALRRIIASRRSFLPAALPLLAKILGVHLRAPFPKARLAFRVVGRVHERPAAIAGRGSAFTAAFAAQRLFRPVGSLEAAFRRERIVARRRPAEDGVSHPASCPHC